MKSNKIIITDIDWVIVNSNIAFYWAMYHVAWVLWKQITQKDINNFLRNRQYFDSFYGKDINKAYELFKDYCKEETSWELYDIFHWIEETLDECKSMWYKIAAFTDRTKKAANFILQHHWISKYFDEIVSKCDTWVSKPNPDWINKIIQSLRLQTSNVVCYVVDSFVDHQAAINANVPFLWVTTWILQENDWESVSARNIWNFNNLKNFID